ncbi:MAG: aminotransferase class V-fold PLP-dependent enzyme [Candidatus Aminicenantes bacterium]|nr:aminotransferase class V-fold PLP-dependent enzyme [Candidatus Aminicenantes bacterium]
MWNRKDLKRRDFLRDCAVGVGVMSGPGSGVLERIFAAGRDLADMSPEQAAANEDFWFEVQQAFTEDRNIINLNNGTVQNGLRIVQEAVRRHTDFTGNAAWHSMAILGKEIESCRRRLASHLGCDPEELVICRGGTEAGQIPILGLELKRGDEIVITNQDYPRLLSAWKQREKREGIVLKIVKLPSPPVPLDQFYQMVEQLITPRTKLIHVCHMTHWTGQMAPIRRLSDLAHAKGIEVLVDGAHGFMHVPFKLADLGCDFYTASLHKWLLAPPGNGFVRIPKNRIPNVWPLTPPWTDDPTNIRRYEDVGTRTPANRIAIAEAITFNEGIGLERKSARIQYLKARWADRLRGLPKVRFYSSLDPAESCGVTTVGIEGMDMAKLTNHLLDKWGIVVSPMKHPEGIIDGVRVVVNVSLSVREIDYFADVMEDIVKKGLPT